MNLQVVVPIATTYDFPMPLRANTQCDISVAYSRQSDARVAKRMLVLKHRGGALGALGFQGLEIRLGRGEGRHRNCIVKIKIKLL